MMLAKLRKFGLEYSDLPTMLGNVADLLRLMALKVDGKEQAKCTENGTFVLSGLSASAYAAAIYFVFLLVAGYYYLLSDFFMLNQCPWECLDYGVGVTHQSIGTSILYVILIVISVTCYLYVYVFSALWFVFWRETEDRVVDMVILSLGLASFIAVTKLFCLHLKSRLVRKALGLYLSCDQRVDRDSRMYRNLMYNLRIVKRRAMFVWIMLISNGIIYISKPIVLPGKHLIEDTQIIYGLEPMFDSPNFELAYIITAIGAMLTVYAPATISGLLIIFAGYIEAQMTALSHEVKRLWDDAQLLNFDDVQNEKDLKKLKNQYIKHKLESIVQSHATNLALLRLTECIFSNSMALEFGFLGMALIAELLGGLENTYLEVPFALVLVSMDCFTGQRLMEASVLFKESVYACKWENFDVSNMKTVLMILKNSEAMLLSAGGVAELRYTSLMAVFRSIYSTYTTLRSTMHGDNPRRVKN